MADELRKATQKSAQPDVGRNLVLGFATDYKAEDMMPFVRSLRSTGFGGEVVLWVSELDCRTEKFLKEYEIQYRYCWEILFVPWAIALVRSFTYYGYLRTIQPRCADRILLTDVRDVVFQEDPFRAAPEGEVVVFLEDASMSLDRCELNSRWLRQAYGEELLQELRGRRISCSGTVLGTWAGITNYLLNMQLAALECSPDARGVWGIDQGLHNMIVHGGRLASLRVEENAEHVFTMGLVPTNGFRITATGDITDQSGRVCPIIHQYDRHPAVVAAVNQRYGRTPPER